MKIITSSTGAFRTLRQFLIQRRRSLALLLIAGLVLSITACGADDGKMAFNETAGTLRAPTEKSNTEDYDRIYENPFLDAKTTPLSTFSIDVDTASYSNVRRFINSGTLPPKDAVRIEELINYFKYDYPEPRGEHPVSVVTNLARSPWNEKHLLTRIALKGKSISLSELPARNFVFLIDCSGSMSHQNKLPLFKKSLGLLVNQLTAQDRIAIVTYAGDAGLVLRSTPGNQKQRILSAINGLDAGGSTNGGAGIKLAYETALGSFIPGGLNRVIIGTDGDFNVGISSEAELIRLIEEKRKSEVFLSVIGLGQGNLKASRMEKIAQHGNGQYAYIDSISEAHKLFVEQGGAMMVIAKDVKLQVEFNPAKVGYYRLIGYENRLLRDQDFNDDKKDAGDMGAGHTVTAFYEIVPAGEKINVPGVDPLKYQKPGKVVEGDASKEWLTVKLRYKHPEADKSKLLAQALTGKPMMFDQAPDDFRFATAVTGFGLVLRDSKYKGNADLDRVLRMARTSRGEDASGHRGEFLKIVESAKGLSRPSE